MDNFKYYNPTKIIFGKNTIGQIGREISKYGLKKVLLLAGGGSIKTNSVYETTINSLKQYNIEWIESWGVIPNPVLSHSEKSLQILRDFGAEAVLAVGGGSVIDEAKAICAGYFKNQIWSLFDGTDDRLTQALPLFVIQTLSATGSEMNSYAVLTNDKTQQKWDFGSPFTFPKVSIIDPYVQMSLPWRQTVNGAVDSLSHVMENYFGGIDQEITLSINEAIMKTIIQAIDKLQVDKNDYNSRAEFAWSSSLALSGLTSVSMQGGEWVVHRIGHGISALFPKVAHAESLSVLFPAWIKYVSQLKPEIFERWAKNIWQQESIDLGIIEFQSKLRQWKAPISLADLNIDEESIIPIAKNSIELGPIGNIKSINYEDMVNILKLSL